MHARYIPLFWRLFIPNATVLAAAALVLHLQPANGRIPAIAGGVVMMLVVNLVLMRRAVTPLERLTDLMGRVDPLRPGERIPAPQAESEVGVLTEAFNEMLDRLETERRESLRRTLSEREAERRRVADELHDEIGQNLTALALQLDRLHKRAPLDVRGEVVDLRDSVLASVEDVRGVVRTLRPEGLDALGLPAALSSLATRLTQQTGIRIVRELQRDLPPLENDQELVLYRVAQESVTNAIRHAQAGCIAISLTADGKLVELTVRDDGVGIDERCAAATDGGIRSMRERALSVGGRLVIKRRTDGPGTEVRLVVSSES
ncbi:MAG TPA: HAMP domain-containing sensor histidine kinase [Solirubrobacteraceae bacterium]|nr:HAMP domain-containing sensor histidine kinase [Solirubrobacteraceae bacterium]